MRKLRIDIETYSPVDLAKSGVYAYASHPEFEILLFSYAYDRDQIQIVDMAAGEEIPEDVVEDLYNPDVLKSAFNALFERTCLNIYFEELPIEQWECTMVRAAMCGLPLQLGKVAEVLKLAEQKDTAGKALIRFFSIPCKPSKTNGGRTRNFWHHAPEKWEAFKKYCKQDVSTERSISEKLSFFEIPEMERLMYILDQKINDFGVAIDPVFVRNAIAINARVKREILERSVQLTGLDNPNSVAQLKAWLEEELDEELESLKKSDIPLILKGVEDKSVVQQVLQNRQELSKTSVKKYSAMLMALNRDGRIRGLTQYYGANRTGRWAGRIVQLQNLPQNHLNDLDLARQCVLENKEGVIDLLYSSIADTLSQLIRTAFIPSKGRKFFVADFSAIEARVIAWLADEAWRLQVFATHGKIYEASAAQMFKVPIESVTKGSPLRQKGKISELALGYQGGVGALTTMGALNMGLQESELKGLVDAWRKANPAIVGLWYIMEKAAKKALVEGKAVVKHGLYFEYKNNVLYMVLPSGRKLCYVRPKLVAGRLGETIVYEGMDQTTKQWKRMDTYGGKLTENAVQAIARDCLAVAMLRLDKANFDIAFHVHDEVVADQESDNYDETLSNMIKIMGRPISWAPGLLLKADGYYCDYYKKD